MYHLIGGGTCVVWRRLLLVSWRVAHLFRLEEALVGQLAGSALVSFGVVLRRQTLEVDHLAADVDRFGGGGARRPGGAELRAQRRLDTRQSDNTHEYKNAIGM